MQQEDPITADRALATTIEMGQSRRVAVPKDTSIVSVLERLRADLGGDAFTVLDHWDSDLFAVGVARPSDPRYLVYISTLTPDGTFSFDCERPSADPELPYDSDGMVDGATYADVREAVRTVCKGNA